MCGAWMIKTSINGRTLAVCKREMIVCGYAMISIGNQPANERMRREINGTKSHRTSLRKVAGLSSTVEPREPQMDTTPLPCDRAKSDTRFVTACGTPS